MKRSAARFVLCVAMACALVCTCSQPSQHVTVRGRVLGHDGRPMRAGYASISGMGVRERADVAANGEFTLELQEPGGYFLWLGGVHHASLNGPLYIDAPGVVQFEARLAVPPYDEPIDSLQVVGVPSDAASEPPVYPMQRQPDGTFTATIAATADTFAYRIHGMHRGDYLVEGTQADRYAWSKGRGIYGGHAGVFDSIVRCAVDTVRITFDPSLLPRSQAAGAVAFAVPQAWTARIWAVSDAFEQIQMREWNAFEVHRASGADPQTFKYDGSRDMNDALALMQQQDAPLLQHYALLQILSSLHAEKPDSSLARRVLREVPPESVLWSLIWSSPGQAIVKLYREARADSLVCAYSRRVIDTHADREVRSAFLLMEVGRAYNALRAEQDSASTHAGVGPAQQDFALLYDRLTTDHAETNYAERAKAMYGPQRLIQPGRSLPDFALASLDDSSVTWNRAALAGRVVLLDFWAVWCGPCVAEMPYLHAAYDRYKDRGFTILSLSFDHRAGDVAAFRAGKWPMPWMHAFVTNGFQSPLAKEFEVIGIPKPILVDTSGVILAVDGLRGDDLDKQLARHFAGPPP